jgi:proteasome lid subunit RPN8/RPN11
MIEVLLAETANSVMISSAAAAHPGECGGILLGVHQGRRPWVTHVLAIPSARVSPSHYELPIGVTQPLVDCARCVDNRLGYIGEWHSHPANVGPSLTDGRTMRGLPKHRHESPILLLVRRGSHDYQIEAYSWTRSRRRSPRLIKTGGLLQD